MSQADPPNDVAPPPGVTPRVEWLVAASLSSFAYVYALSSGSTAELVATLALGLIVPCAVIVFRQGLTIRSSVYNSVTAFVLAAYLLLNVLIHFRHYYEDPTLASALAHVCGFIVYLFVLNWIASNLNVRSVLAKLALLLIPLAVIALVARGLMFTGRYVPFTLQPNWWGELVVAMAICTLAVDVVPIKIVSYGLGALLLFEVQSRSGMLGWSVAVGIEMLRAWKSARLSGRVTLAGLVGLAGLVFVASHGTRLFLLDKVLLLNNPYRGLGTGFTGRVQGWEQAWAAFRSNAVLGRGMGLYEYVHNGFLQVVSEGGCVLGVIFLGFLGGGVRQAWIDRDYVKIGALFAFVGYAAFQPRAFNVDLATLLFWLGTREWQRVRTTGSGLASSRGRSASPVARGTGEGGVPAGSVATEA